MPALTKNDDSFSEDEDEELVKIDAEKPRQDQLPPPRFLTPPAHFLLCIDA